MSCYENAPATKLLATNCAACGRALVDAVSVERGVGPDCAEMHGFSEAQGAPDFAAAAALLDGSAFTLASDDARECVNHLVHRLAAPIAGVDRGDARKAFSAIAALGFEVLAARIARRWRTTVERYDAAQAAADTAFLRGEYARLRALLCYGGQATPYTVNVAAACFKPKTPLEWVEALGKLTLPCVVCNSTGKYRGEAGGECFRCGGHGNQDLNDCARNRAYDALRASGKKAA